VARVHGAAAQGGQHGVARLQASETWLRFLERPDIAHCGYTLNRTVIGLIAQGHRVDEKLPEAPVVASSQCF
jgi:hypothetical protein